MIIAPLSDPLLRSAVRRAAHPEEDVFCKPQAVLDALAFGFPRLLVRAAEDPSGWLLDAAAASSAAPPTLVLTRATLQTWESERRKGWVPAPRVEHLAKRLQFLVERPGPQPTWVDRTIADLSRASGRPLPPAFRSFARRVLEFPWRYQDLHPLADLAAMSRGALKARFRRRGLASPAGYLRWLRVLAAAHILSDAGVTTLQAADRLGCATGGNFCRMIKSATGLTPTEIRSPIGRSRLIAGFASGYLTRVALEAWLDLDDLFVRAA